jgi:transcriptional regulator with XRE-family HTH domain
MSQADLAAELEEKRHKPVSQQLISDIENRETIEDDELLKQIAEILKVGPEVIKNLNWDAAITVIGNTFTNHDYSQQQFATYIHNSPIYHPLDKLLELFQKEKDELRNEIQQLKNENEGLRKGKK